MSAPGRHNLTPYPAAWIRTLADAAGRLAEAIAEAMHCREHPPRYVLRVDAPRVEPDLAEVARQQALLWAVALVIDSHQRSRSGGQEAAPSGTFAPRLTDILTRIAAACAGAPSIRAAVHELRAATEVPRRQGAPASDGPADSSLVHLVEQLWAASDDRLRRQRGGYFTPAPLVGFIVRSVHHLLQRALDIPDGLATESDVLRVIDPACGSGAFLLGVIDFLRRLPKLQPDGCWQRFTRDQLQSRLVGVDVLPACCGAVDILVQMQLGLLWRAHCGNALEEVDVVQRRCGSRLPVIIGNPPYANFGRHNRGSWIRQQLAAYKAGLGERKHNLDDDCVKFLRWGQYWIDQAGGGILAMVTNHTYLAGLTHRVMRASLATSFDHLYLLDLHGNQKKRERTPTGAADENVFDIQAGVAIGLFVKCRTGAARREATVQHAELWGSRSEKLATLAAADVTSIPWRALAPRPPHYFFVPRSGAEEAVYRQWPRLDEIFEQHVSGVQSKCDSLFVGFTPGEVERQMGGALEESAGEADAAVGVPAWLRPRLAGVAFDPAKVRPYMVAPWDVRWIYYDPSLLGRARYRVLRHLDRRNVALVFMRQATGAEPYDQVLATRVLVSDRVFYSAHGAPFVAPLYTGEGAGRRTNLQALFLQKLASRLGTPWNDAPADAHPDASFSSHDVFHWLYAVLHSARYRRRFDALLRVEFPRLPWPPDVATFRELARLGRTLAEAHCDVATAWGGNAREEDAPTARETPPAAVSRRSAESGRDAAAAWRESVEEAVWQFRIGGYRVLPRWFRQRENRVLIQADHRHVQRMVAATRQTLHCSQAIDQLAWPTVQGP